MHFILLHSRHLFFVTQTLNHHTILDLRSYDVNTSRPPLHAGSASAFNPLIPYLKRQHITSRRSTSPYQTNSMLIPLPLEDEHPARLQILHSKLEEKRLLKVDLIKAIRTDMHSLSTSMRSMNEPALADQLDQEYELLQKSLDRAERSYQVNEDADKRIFYFETNKALKCLYSELDMWRDLKKVSRRKIDELATSRREERLFDLDWRLLADWKDLASF